MVQHRRSRRTDGGPSAGERSAGEPEWRVGTASAPITPDGDDPHHLIGFGAREGPMDGVDQDIHARAVALEDRTGRRLVVLSFELLFVFESQRAFLETECAERWDLEPESLLLNPSHTHYGPDYDVHNEALKDDPDTNAGLVRDPDADEEVIAAYREFVDQTLLTVVGEALGDLEPASLSHYRSKCAITMNRRRPTEAGFGFNPHSDGPVDHDLPVLTASTPDGTTKAILFGYACHPTVAMAGCNEVTGDWPGYTMDYLEAAYPDATAAFLIGCAGDQKAYPEGTKDFVKKHARTVATAVERALVTVPRPVRGPLTLVRDQVDLDVEQPITDDDGGRIEREDAGSRPYPVQGVGFGTDLTLLSLSGEVLADFSLQLKETLASPLWVAGYADNTGYLPTKRVLAEGGYEAWQSFEDGRYAPSTEERILSKAVAVAERAGGRRSDV